MNLIFNQTHKNPTWLCVLFSVRPKFGIGIGMVSQAKISFFQNRNFFLFFVSKNFKSFYVFLFPRGIIVFKKLEIEHRSSKVI